MRKTHQDQMPLTPIAPCHPHAEKLETGRKVRVDCTVVETPIHEPTDSSLLFDGVRVLSRLMGQANKAFGLSYTDHSRRAKRRAMGILNATTQDKRVPLYQDLL